MGLTSLVVFAIIYLGVENMPNGKLSDDNTRYSLTISKELKQTLEKIADEQNRSLNNLIITILREYVKTR